MKIVYRKSVKRMVCAALSVVVMAACSQWTEPEGLDIITPSIEDQNPELYAEYIEDLKVYKQSEHKVMVVKFENKQTLPAGQGEHLNALPDSIDYVILNNPDNLSETITREMKEIREKKATKTLFSINYAVIEKEYQAILEETGNEAEEAETEETKEETETETDGFPEFCAQQMDTYLALFNKYAYDGINVIYSGTSPQTLPEAEKEKLRTRQNAFFEKITNWKNSNANAIMLFEGTPHNLLYDNNILRQAQFIIIPTVDATSRNQLISAVESSITKDVPSDRLIFSIKAPNPKDEDEGYYTDLSADGTPMTAIMGAAYTAIAAKGDFTKAGLCVENAQNDYYNFPKTYKNIREAITIMNPSF